MYKNCKSTMDRLKCNSFNNFYIGKFSRSFKIRNSKDFKNSINKKIGSNSETILNKKYIFLTFTILHTES